MNTVSLGLRLRAAHHELDCWECRVTWRSWAQRLLGLSRGYSPTTARRETGRQSEETPDAL